MPPRQPRRYAPGIRQKAAITPDAARAAACLPLHAITLIIKALHYYYADACRHYAIHTYIRQRYIHTRYATLLSTVTYASTPLLPLIRRALDGYVTPLRLLPTATMPHI